MELSRSIARMMASILKEERALANARRKCAEKEKAYQGKLEDANEEKAQRFTISDLPKGQA